MEYTELDIRLKDHNPFSEIIIARLKPEGTVTTAPKYK